MAFKRGNFRQSHGHFLDRVVPLILQCIGTLYNALESADVFRVGVFRVEKNFDVVAVVIVSFVGSVAGGVAVAVVTAVVVVVAQRARNVPAPS